MEEAFYPEQVLKNGLVVLISKFKKAAAMSDKAQYNTYYNGLYDAYHCALLGFGFSIKELDDMVLEAIEEKS